MRKTIAFLTILLILNTSVFAFYENTKEDNYEEEIIATAATNNMILNATNAILYDKTYDRVLLEKKAYERVPNASTTKMLTAIVAFENANVQDIVTISRNAANTGGSVINLRSGDKVTLDGLIKGLLVHSGNDAAVAIAEFVGGSVEDFSEMLNQKAYEMGLRDTHFVTPHGLDKENHYSTAYDLAIIADYLLDIEYLANIVGLKTVNIKINDQTRIITTTNEMLSLYDGANGVKTGFTGDAGRCLVTSCMKEGRTLISVVLGCKTKGQRTSDSIKLLNYGYNEYEIVDICKNMKKEFIINVKKGKDDYYKILVNSQILLPILKEEKDSISYQYDLKTSFIAPLKENTKIGTIAIMLDKDVLRSIEIRLPKTIQKKEILDYFTNFLSNGRSYYEIKMWQ